MNKNKIARELMKIAKEVASTTDEIRKMRKEYKGDNDSFDILMENTEDVVSDYVYDLYLGMGEYRDELIAEYESALMLVLKYDVLRDKVSSNTINKIKTYFVKIKKIREQQKKLISVFTNEAKKLGLKITKGRDPLNLQAIGEYRLKTGKKVTIEFSITIDSTYMLAGYVSYLKYIYEIMKDFSAEEKKQIKDEYENIGDLITNRKLNDFNTLKNKFKSYQLMVDWLDKWFK